MSEEPVDFYGGPFSNFARSTIKVDVGFGLQIYDTVEHAFQAAKSTNVADHYRVKGAPSAGLAKQEGRRIPLRHDWEQIKYDVMLRCLRSKFQIPFYKTLLLDTGNREIREDSPTDRVWGYRNGGQNLLGKALMQVRKEIREHAAEGLIIAAQKALEGNDIVYLHNAKGGEPVIAMIAMPFFIEMTSGPHFPPREYTHDHIEPGEWEGG